MPSRKTWIETECELALCTCHHEASQAVVAWRVGEMAGFIQLGAVFGGEVSWIPLPTISTRNNAHNDASI
jgi:hypothetical protein